MYSHLSPTGGGNKLPVNSTEGEDARTLVRLFHHVFFEC